VLTILRELIAGCENKKVVKSKAESAGLADAVMDLMGSNEPQLRNEASIVIHKFFSHKLNAVYRYEWSTIP